MTKLPNTNINVFFVQNDWYFSCFQEVYPRWLDPRYEHERYIAFSLATLEYAKQLNFIFYFLIRLAIDATIIPKVLNVVA